MKLRPFLLDQWLNSAFGSNVNFDLGSSAGPAWTLNELMALMKPEEKADFMETAIVYSEAAGTQILRNAIAAFSNVDPDYVQVCTGASEALLILFFLAAEPGANVVIPFPVFPPVSEYPAAFGMESRFYRLRPQDGFKTKVEEIKALVDRNTKLIFVNTPHNPTGAVLDEPDLLALHDFAADRGIQFVVDEVYHPLYHSSRVTSAASLSSAIVLGDLSKALCMSGLRTGWIIDRDPARRHQYLDARSYFTISNSPITEALSAVALKHADKMMARAVDVTSRNLELLDAFFARHDPLLRWVRPEGGTTAFPWLTSGQDARTFCASLLQKGVMLVPGDCFGMPAHMRLGFGKCVTGLDQALTTMEQELKRTAALLR